MQTVDSKSSPNFKTATRFINRLISKDDHGLLVWDRKKGAYHPIHVNTRDQILERACGGRWLSTITRAKYAAHFDGLDTWYFTAHERHTNDALVMIDIDCHDGVGTLAGAIEFAEFLKNKIFQGMFYEKSTNGNGIHGYVILQKEGKTPKETNEFLNKLQNYLQGYQHLFDVQMVEVKGHCREVIWNGRQIKAVHMGSLAKLPREAVTRWEEFSKTTRIWIDGFSFPVVSGARHVMRLVQGSVGRGVQDWKPLEAMALQIMGGRTKVKVRDELVLVVEDVAVLLAILHFCTRSPNEDGSMRTSRIQALWNSMYGEGNTTRQWHCSRYAAARNLIDQHEGIEWISSEYVPKQIPCKWHLTDSVMESIDAIYRHVSKNNGSTSASLSLSPSTTTKQPERDTLILGDGSLGLGWKPEGAVTRPEATWPSQSDLPDGYEVLKYLKMAA